MTTNNHTPTDAERDAEHIRGWIEAAYIGGCKSASAANKLLREENTTLREKLAQFEWRPIETAPRDGTRIILYSPYRVSRKSGRDVTCSRITIGYWRDGECATDINKHRRVLTIKHGGYWTTHFKGMRSLDGLPSHWMPLPQPPAKTEDG